MRNHGLSEIYLEMVKTRRKAVPADYSAESPSGILPVGHQSVRLRHCSGAAFSCLQVVRIDSQHPGYTGCMDPHGPCSGNQNLKGITPQWSSHPDIGRDKLPQKVAPALLCQAKASLQHFNNNSSGAPLAVYSPWETLQNTHAVNYLYSPVEAPL